MPPPVTAVPPISNDKAAFAPEIAPCKDVIILTILPPSGTATNVDEAVEISCNLQQLKSNR